MVDMLERFGIIGHMNKLDSTKRAQVIATLVEGCSVNSTARRISANDPEAALGCGRRLRRCA